MKQVRTRYSKEFKIKAVELWNQNGSVTAVADQLGVSHESIRQWQRLLKQGKLTLDSGSVEKVKSKEEEELSRLRKELYDVKLERDILKKAVSIFSKSDR